MLAAAETASSSFEFCWGRGRNIPGWFSEGDARLLWECCTIAAKESKDVPTFVEIGSYMGRSSTLLMGHGARVVLIDPFWLSGAENAKADLDNNLEGFNYTLMDCTSSIAASRMEGVKIDLLFVDGDHGKGGVDLDAELWLPKLRPGGIAVFHDYGDKNYPEVSNVVDGLGWQTLNLFRNLIALRKPEIVPAEVS